MLRAAVIGIAVVGCGSSGPSVAYKDLAGELVHAKCVRLARCGMFPDEASCNDYFRVLPDVSLDGAIAAKVASYNGELGKKCIDALAAQSCDLSADDAKQDPQPCRDMFTGKVAGDASCAIDAECASGTCNLPMDCPPTGCCTGTCRAKQAPAQAGDSCAKAHDCVAGLVCGKQGMCVAPVAMGMPCFSDRECADGLACINPMPTQAGACRPLPHVGESCPYLRCADLNARCDDANTMKCIALGLAAAPCPNGDECSPYLECNPTAHTCNTIPDVGMACPTSRCAGDAFCNMAGTCVATLGNGQPCDGYNFCESFYCEQGPIFDSCKDPYVCF